MDKYANAIELFIGIVKGLRKKQFNIKTPLDKMVLKTSKTNLAYVDNRKDAKYKHNFDFWNNIKKGKQKKFKDWIKEQGIEKRVLYSKSQEFPDFLFKVRKENDKLTNGSLLELKDSKGGSIASFNSTLPTKYKNLNEIDIINGDKIVSRIAAIMDGQNPKHRSYRTFQRRNFYLIRTNKGSNKKVKISIIDGSFFETLSKKNLIYRMFLNVLADHLKKKKNKRYSKQLNKLKKYLNCITDQTIIAKSQDITKASIRPRLRIMAEVRSEGNPHSNHYPEIEERSVNLILRSSSYNEEIKKWIFKQISDLEMFTIKHKRNGEHIVFEFKLK